MAVVTVGIDLAKNVFAVHGVNKNGNAVLVNPKVSRTALPELIASLPSYTIGMEACSGAHYWARLFREYSHDVKLMAPKFVSPYRQAGKSGKNNAADALAICEAVRRPHMRFVPVKDEEQQSMQCLHRTRQGFIEERTASYNRLRGLISEFGLVTSQSTEQLRKLAREQRENLPGWVSQYIDDLLSHIDSIELKIADYDRILVKIAARDSRSKNIMKLRGVGPTTAITLIASIVNGHDFKNGRQLAAWQGLTPSQYSSGGKARLGKITKAGDAYLRTLLVQGARSVMVGVEHKQAPFSRWVCSLINRRGYWRAAVALAAKNDRLCWASLNYGDDFKLYSSPNS